MSAKHPLPDYLNLLKLNGRLAIVGVPPEPLELPSGSLIFQRRLVGGSLIGGVRETQEMLVRLNLAVLASKSRMRTQCNASIEPGIAGCVGRFHALAHNCCWNTGAFRLCRARCTAEAACDLPFG